MPTTPPTKADQAATIALEAIHAATPGLLSMAEVAEKVAERTHVTTGTARKWLRAACASGALLELTPSRHWTVELPGAQAAAVGPHYISAETVEGGPERRIILTKDNGLPAPSPWGPGRTTYLVDPQQARDYLQALASEKTATQNADREARAAAKKAERDEIARRFPGLRRALRKAALLGNGRKGGEASFTAYLDNPPGDKTAALPPSQREASVHIHASGDLSVAVLHTILDAGTKACIESQPLVRCAHCAGRILHTDGRYGTFWWHAETANAMCAEGDTKAAPARD
jgi:hypothetical protein